MRVGQNVRLASLLNKGGMGSIWIADHLTLHTQVAVKFMAVDVSKNPDALGRFSREASAAAQIKSPHVVQTFDHGFTSDGMPYIVMELLEGEDLGRRIQRAGPVPPADVSAIVAQVCKALARAHALGIVHRDIKPENVFLTDLDGDLLVKVLDFGVAKRVEDVAFSKTSTGAMVGTPYYMSPEQVMSAKAADTKSDLWSVAVVAYHALTGRVPFDAETMGALCVAINTGEFVPATRVRPGLPSTVDPFFAKALARDPSKRFQSAKELANALHRAVGFVEDVLSDVSGNRSAVLSIPDAEAPKIVPPPPVESPPDSTATVPLPPPADRPRPPEVIDSSEATGVMMPSASATLLEATVTQSAYKTRRGFYIAVGLAVGVVAFIGLFGMFLLFRTVKKRNEVKAIAAVEATSSIPAASVPAVAPSPEPTQAVEPPPVVEPTFQPEKTEPPPAVAAPTVRKGTRKPTGGKTTTPKPPQEDKYGFGK